MIKSILILACSVALFTGCGTANKNLEPFTMEEIPSALRESFKTAERSILGRAEEIAANVESDKLPAASIQLNRLAAVAELTDEQRIVVGKAMTAVNQRLQETIEAAQSAVAAGGEGVTPAPRPGQPAPDMEEAAAAATILRHYQSTK